VAWSILDCARRTSTIRACAFREQEDDQATRSFIFQLLLGACLTCLRDEANEVQLDARPQARKNRSRIRWNTLRIFQGRERRRWLQIIRHSRTVMSDRLLEAEDIEDDDPHEDAVVGKRSKCVAFHK
jgi:hypothetical protein